MTDWAQKYIELRQDVGKALTMEEVDAAIAKADGATK